MRLDKDAAVEDSAPGRQFLQIEPERPDEPGRLHLEMRVLEMLCDGNGLVRVDDDRDGRVLSTAEVSDELLHLPGLVGHLAVAELEDAGHSHSEGGGLAEEGLDDAVAGGDERDAVRVDLVGQAGDCLKKKMMVIKNVKIWICNAEHARSENVIRSTTLIGTDRSSVLDLSVLYGGCINAIRTLKFCLLYAK